MPGPIASVTLGVPHLEQALDWFRDRLRLAVVAQARASVGLLAAWKRPVHEAAELVELAVPGRRLGRIRLAHFESGLAAMAAGARGPCALCLPAAVIDEVAQVAPEWLDLVEIAGDEHAVLAVRASDLEATTRFYVDGLRWQPQPVRGAGGESRVFSFTPDEPGIRVHTRARSDAGAASPIMPGHPGVNLVSCSCDDLDAALDRLTALDIEPLTRPTHVGFPGGRPGRVMLVHGPAGELFELTELAA